MNHRLLLDTHTFLFAAEEHPSLSGKARHALLHTNNTLYISLVSLWEIQIKLSLGKLKLPMPLQDAVQRAVTDLNLEILPLQLEHIYLLDKLPFHHRDPFDRLLIAQALCERMTVLGRDVIFNRYGVSRLW